jgi:hypothetical protein
MFNIDDNTKGQFQIVWRGVLQIFLIVPIKIDLWCPSTHVNLYISNKVAGEMGKGVIVWLNHNCDSKTVCKSNFSFGLKELYNFSSRLLGLFK